MREENLEEEQGLTRGRVDPCPPGGKRRKQTSAKDLSGRKSYYLENSQRQTKQAHHSFIKSGATTVLSKFLVGIGSWTPFPLAHHTTILWILKSLV